MSAAPPHVLVPRRTWLLVRAAAVVTSSLCLVLALAVGVMAALTTRPPTCLPGLLGQGRNFRSPGVFSDLSPGEMVAVRDYMLGLPRLQLTPYGEASVNTSYIYLITLQTQLKYTVLQFLQGQGRPPRRAARVVVYRGGARPPRVEEYLVGPLPAPTYARLVMTPVYRRVPIPFSSRPVDAVERRQLKLFLSVVLEPLHSMFVESYNLRYHNCTPKVDCITFRDFAPRGTVSGERLTWFWAYRDTDGLYLHPLGFIVQIDHLDTDTSQWKVTRLMYNGILWYEVQDLAERFREGDIRKIKPTMDKIDARFSTYSRRGHESFDTHMRGPRLVEPDGHRYVIEDQFVKYFGWSFNFHMKTTTGLQILDVYFQGEKIAYEMSLQEIAAFYTGYTPETKWLALYGVSWLLGASSFELMPGVDCPYTATFIDSYHFVNSDRPRRHKNSICIFEQNNGIPLRRHFSRDSSGEFSSYGGMVSYSLVVRTIINLWNSDYIIDYVFHLDGSIQLKTSLTGYVHSSFELDLDNVKSYGNRLYENIRGNANQHLFHWKVDLDIEQTTNRYQTVAMGTETQSGFTWYPEDQYGNLTHTQLNLNTVLKEDEKEAAVTSDVDPSVKHYIYNHKADNRFEAYRSYEVVNSSPSRFLQGDAPLARAAGWARYPLCVTRYKDVEDVSSSIYAQGDPYDPVLDFSRYLDDNDTIVDADLVTWLATGMYHVPHAEDVPSTATTSSSTTITLKPYNFFNHCPSLAVSDALTAKVKDKKVTYDTFGTRTGDTGCYQREADFQRFTGRDDPV